MNLDIVVVTGGAGFIGSATCEFLLRNGSVNSVIAIDNLFSGSIDNVRYLIKNFNSKFKLLVADVREFSKLWELLKGLKGQSVGIIHLAAMINIEEVRRRPYEAIDINMGGTANLLELARKIDARKFVLASSVAVYGEPKYLPINEEHPTNPANLYGLTKLFSEHLLWRYYEDYRISSIALRYFNVYGPRMRPGPYAGVVYKFITTLLRNERPIIYGDGEQTRDFIYVYDVAEANAKALSSDYVGPINIGSGEEVSINNLYRIITELLNKKVPPKYGPMRPGDVKRSRADISKAKNILSWRPKTHLVSGLKLTIDYYTKVLRDI